MRIRTLLPSVAASCLLANGLVLRAANAASPVPDSPRPARYAVGLSPFLSDSVKDEIYRHIVRLVLEDLPLNSSLWLYDAYHIRTIAQIEIPDVRAFRSAKTRANQFQERIQELRRFLATPQQPPAGTMASYEAALRVPQFLDFIGENLAGAGRSVAVILLGSPIYLDEKEPAFSMASGYFPSDGHLNAAREQSVFGTKDRAGLLDGVALYWGHFGDPWVSEIHREKVGRFWALFLKQQGGRLPTFSGDLPTVFSAVRDTEPAPDGGACRFELDPSQSKIEMLRLSRDVEVTDWITRELPANRRHGPPASTVGPMKIGIRWQGHLDLDLYSRPTAEAETLYFRHRQSSEGYYFKDHRSSPEREYEFIEFLKPVDVREAQAFVNFYAGEAPGGAEGEVRIEFDGKIYASRFAIRAGQGNRGRAGDAQSEFWTPLDIPRILELR